MTTSCDPGELARLARSGDIAALDHLTRCQGQRLLAVGRRQCGREEDAVDAVQDALVSAATHLTDWRGDGPIEGWVTRMVARACSRLRRGRKHDPSLHSTDVDVATTGDDPETAAGRARIAAALGDALLGLEPMDRAVLLLAEAEGWTGPEIAAEVGSTPDAVRARLTRVRRKVREALEGRV